MTDLTKPLQPKSDQVMYATIPRQTGVRLVYMTQKGIYLGTIEVDAASNEALLNIANLFRDWCIQQVSGIQIASGNGIAGLRS